MLLQNGFQISFNYLQAADFIFPIGPQPLTSENILFSQSSFSFEVDVASSECSNPFFCTMA